VDCVGRRQGETRPGKTTVVLPRGGDQRPAGAGVRDLQRGVRGRAGGREGAAAAEASARAGVTVEIRDYVAA
jgi:hypothetical protein